MKVWGIGLGRTGTKSLCEALKVLGHKVIHNPPDLDSLSAPDVDGCAEGTTAFHFRYLDLRFPDSKFILTTRPLHSWLGSNKRAIENLYPLERFNEKDSFYNYMVRNRSSRFGSLNYNKDKLIEKYYQHHADVVAHFKGRMDQLLIIDLTAQNNHWEPLCVFLNKDIPAQDFPHITEPPIMSH